MPWRKFIIYSSEGSTFSFWKTVDFFYLDGGWGPGDWIGMQVKEGKSQVKVRKSQVKVEKSQVRVRKSQVKVRKSQIRVEKSQVKV